MSDPDSSITPVGDAATQLRDPFSPPGGPNQNQPNSSPFSSLPLTKPSESPVSLETPNLWTLYIQDRSGKPIIGLNGWLKIDNKELPFTSGEKGEIPSLPRSDRSIHVEVKKIDGGRKKVSELTLLPSTESVVLTSPKTKHEGQTRIHDGEPPRSSDSTTKYGDWIREAMKARIDVSGVRFNYQSNSSKEQDRYHWEPSKQLQQIMKESVAPAKTGVGKVTIPALGQGNSAPTRNPQGNPATVVGVEAWNGQLALGINEKWRPALEEAVQIDSVKTAGIKLFALAAIINSEAGTVKQAVEVETIVRDKKHHALKDKAGIIIKKKTTKHIDTGEWDENAKNPTGDASGLTQFIKSTWKGWAMTHPDSALGKEALKLGYMKYEEKPIVSKKSKKGNAKDNSAPKTKKALVIKDIGSLQNLRFDGRLSILTSAEGGAENLKSFENSYKFKVSSITNSFEIAKIVYFLHFLGPARASKLGKGEMSEETAKYLYCQQFVSKNDSSGEIQGGKNYTDKGWASWRTGLWEFAGTIIDGRLKSGFLKYCRPEPNDNEIGRNIKDIIEAIK